MARRTSSGTSSSGMTKSESVRVGSGHRSVHGAHVHHASAFDAVQPDVAADRRGVIKLKDEFAVGGLALALLLQSVILSGRTRFACESGSGVEGPLVRLQC